MENEIGTIIHYYDKIGVGVVRLSAELRAGDLIHVKGKATDFEQTAGSLQVDHQPVPSAKRGEEVAIKMEQKVKEGDVVYKK
jgi:putative protease